MRIYSTKYDNNNSPRINSRCHDSLEGVVAASFRVLKALEEYLHYYTYANPATFPACIYIHYFKQYILYIINPQYISRIRIIHILQTNHQIALLFHLGILTIHLANSFLLVHLYKLEVSENYYYYSPN